MIQASHTNDLFSQILSLKMVDLSHTIEEGMPV